MPRNQPIQIILFSATFPDNVRSFASKFAPKANKIELKKEELSLESVKQFYMDCRNEEHKYDILVSLYQLLTVGQSIIFCQVIRFVLAFLYLPTLTIFLKNDIAPTYGRSHFTTYDSRRAQGCFLTWSERLSRA